jgi:hypothetical protein
MSRAKYHWQACGLALLMMGMANAAHAENWVQFYADGESSELYDRDSLQATGNGHITVTFKTVFNAPQHPQPNSSIPESQTFYTRAQSDDLDCQAQSLAVLGVWYYDENGQNLGGSRGRSPDRPIQPGTVAALLSQAVCPYAR